MGSLLPETSDTRARLATAIQGLQGRGDTSGINQLVTAYKAKYQTAPPASFSGDVGTALAQRGSDLNTTLQSKQTPMSKDLQIVGQGAGFVTDVIGAGIKKVASLLPNAKAETAALASDPLIQLGAHALKAGGDVWQSFKAAHPEIAGDAGALANIASLLPTSLAAKAGVEAIPSVVKAVGAAKTATSDFANSIKDVNATANALKVSPKLQAIQETISPKLTPKEVKIALDEGRILPGKDPTLLHDGTPDLVLPSDKTVSATQTIASRIPDAEKMTQPQLYSALDTHVSGIAQKLAPEMKAVPITEDVVSKITNDWNTLKAKQLADPYAPSTANVEKIQANFEDNYLKTSNADTLHDLWETRIRYDNSVPASVKNANALSSEALQTQKSMWLQNRAILNDAIHDSSSGLGKTSQTAFAHMSDMYNAQKSIQSSFKLSKGMPSKVRQFADKHPVVTGAVIATAAGATGVPQKIVGAIPGL